MSAFVDEFGCVFIGPLEGGEGFRYQRFLGCNSAGDPVWAWVCYWPEADWEPMPPERFDRFLQLYREEATR